MRNILSFVVFGLVLGCATSRSMTVGVSRSVTDASSATRPDQGQTYERIEELNLRLAMLSGSLRAWPAAGARDLRPVYLMNGRSTHASATLVSEVMSLQDQLDTLVRRYAMQRAGAIVCSDRMRGSLPFNGLPSFRDVARYDVMCRVISPSGQTMVVAPIITTDFDAPEVYPLPALPPVLGPTPHPDPVAGRWYINDNPG